VIDYPSIIRNYIATGDYVLESIETRINTFWVEGKLSDDERAELLNLAAKYARDVLNTNVLDRLAALELRVYNLEHPTDIYPVYERGQTSIKGQIYRADVTGDGEYDLVRYDGGRASTSLGIGKIDGWHLLDDALNVAATITRDADKNYIITPVNSEPEEPTEEPTEPTGEPTEPTE
jgi:hypothetical protein